MGIFQWIKKKEKVSEQQTILQKNQEDILQDMKQGEFHSVEELLSNRGIASIEKENSQEDKDSSSQWSDEFQVDSVNEEAFYDYSQEQCREFVEESCMQMKQISERIEETKRELQVVNSYMSDVQLIQNMPSPNKEIIEELAERVVTLERDREAYSDYEADVTDAVYEQMSSIEKNISKILAQMDEEEKLCMKVKKDLNLLEGEKRILKIEKQDMQHRLSLMTGILRGLVISIIALGMLFIAFTMVSQDTYSLIMLGLMTAVMIGIVVVYTITRNTQQNIKLNDMKMNKAIVTMNHIKIKYVNAINHLDYQYRKYKVKNAYELSQMWNKYVVAKKKKENYRRTNTELYSAREDLIASLGVLRLYDTSVWEQQAGAILNKEEQVELLSNLEMRRFSLKEAIDFDLEAIEKMKADVMKLTTIKKEYAQMVLAIVDKIGNLQKSDY